MKVIYVLLFALPLLAHADNKQVKSRKKPTKPVLNCKKITCPAVEEPICVKIKFKREDLKNVTNYILMINKCELNYMKCHQHVEAAIVQMKFCDHSHISKTDKPKLSGRKRVKRTAQYEPNIDKNHKAKKPDANNKVVSKSNGRKKGVRKNNKPSFKARTVKPPKNLIKFSRRSEKVVKENIDGIFKGKSKMFDNEFFGGPMFGPKNQGSKMKKGGETQSNMFPNNMFHKDMFNKNMFENHLRQRGQRTKHGNKHLKRQGTVPNDDGGREKLIVKKKGKSIPGGLDAGFVPHHPRPQKQETAPSNGNQALNDQGTAPKDGGNRDNLKKEDAKNMFDPNFFDMNSQKTEGGNKVSTNQETTPSNGNQALNDQETTPNNGGDRDKLQKGGEENKNNMFAQENMFKGNMFKPDFFHMKDDSEETTTKINNQVLKEQETSSNENVSSVKPSEIEEASSDENPNDKDENADDSEPEFGSPEANKHNSQDKDAKTQPPSTDSGEAETQPPSTESGDAETQPPSSESSDAETQPPSKNNDEAKTEPPSTDEDARVKPKEENNKTQSSSEEVSEGVVLEGEPTIRPEGESESSEKEIDEDVNPPSDSEPAPPDPEKPQNNEDCPTSCPSRAVMTCGRCQHGVFRTFLSVCHMRMFNCKHDDESMELISYYPCVASAPFLSSSKGMNMTPEGTEVDPGDHDQILRFIYCRSKGLVAKPPNTGGDSVEETANDLKNKCGYDNQQRLKHDYASYGE